MKRLSPNYDIFSIFCLEMWHYIVQNGSASQDLTIREHFYFLTSTIFSAFTIAMYHYIVHNGSHHRTNF